MEEKKWNVNQLKNEYIKNKYSYIIFEKSKTLKSPVN